MLLILTNSQDVTADQLILSLHEEKVPYLRFDTDRLISEIEISYRLNLPTIKYKGTWYNASDFSNVWYRRPEQLKDWRYENCPEGKYTIAEWTEFLEGVFAHIPLYRWVNHPSKNAAASHKLEQLTRAVKIGFKVPNTLATQNQNELRDFFRQNNGHVIVKPIASGYVERPHKENDSLIYTHQVLNHHLEELDDLSACPSFFQGYIKKEYDVRITVVDSDIHAVALFANDQTGGQRCDIRRNNMSDVVYKIIVLPATIKTLVIKIMRDYELRFAAIDMAVSKSGDWYFFEINPNGQWAWLDTCAGTKISNSFVASFLISQKCMGP